MENPKRTRKLERMKRGDGRMRGTERGKRERRRRVDPKPKTKIRVDLDHARLG